MIDALLFDLDLTLLDNRNFQQSIVGTCEAIAARVPGLKAETVLEANAEVIRKRPIPLGDWEHGRVSGEELGRTVWRLVIEVCGQNSEDLAEFAAQKHLELAEASYRGCLFEDARELMKHARDRKIPMAIVTNGASDTQRMKLNALGVIDWFEVLAISGEHGVTKPDPALFEVVTKQMGVSGKSVWHVGDNLTTDVGGAQAAGLTGVWINRNGATNDTLVVPEIEVSSMRQLMSAHRDIID